MKTHPRRHIPAVTNLVVFEHCTQLLSFTAVGQTLGLSQGAVSRQVIELEEFLGQTLFTRNKSGLILTAAGQRYVRQIQEHLSGLERASIDLRMGLHQRDVLRIAVSPSFCDLWLVPRLKVFLREHPNLDVSINPEMSYVDDGKYQADLRIVHRTTAAPENGCWDFLMPIDCVVVCSPELMGQRESLTLDELAELPLLHFTRAVDAWPEFFREQGRADISPKGSASNATFAVNIQFAIAGLGVALAPPYFIADELRAGHLVVAHPHALKRGRGFFLNFDEAQRHWEPLTTLRAWLQEQSQPWR